MSSTLTPGRYLLNPKRVARVPLHVVNEENIKFSADIVSVPPIRTRVCKDVEGEDVGPGDADADKRW
jgi:hypothetical protein